MGREQVVRLLESFALDVELALERCGIAPVRPEAGERFSGREHRAVKVVEAAGAEEDGTIVDVLADGYQDVATGRLTAPAKVCVRRWTEPAPTEPAAEPVQVNEHELEERTDG
jgi:molecular chaperone GrpE (heat shock protein)